MSHRLVTLNSADGRGHKPAAGEELRLPASATACAACLRLVMSG